MSFEIEIKPNAFTSKIFSIDDRHVTYHDLQMELQDVTGLRYGATSKRVNGFEVGISYEIGFLDSAEDTIDITFADGLFNVNEAEHMFNSILNAVWLSVGNCILQEYVSKIARGETALIGGFTCTTEGVQISRKPLFGKEKIHTVKWNHIRHSIDEGFLNFKSAIDSDVYASVAITSRWHAVLLCELFQQARTSRATLDYLTGKNSVNTIEPPLA
jgi:hypothetical protein